MIRINPIRSGASTILRNTKGSSRKGGGKCFLKQTLKRNQLLMETAFKFHQSGNILPDTYILDVDVFWKMQRKFYIKLKKNNIRLYFMLKQVGQKSILAKKLVEMGYAGVVAVDYKEALIMMQNQIPIGNIGHLVQVPQACIKRVVAYRPELMTVYSYDKIESIENSSGIRFNTGNYASSLW